VLLTILSTTLLIYLDTPLAPNKRLGDPKVTQISKRVEDIWRHPPDRPPQSILGKMFPPILPWLRYDYPIANDGYRYKKPIKDYVNYFPRQYADNDISTWNFPNPPTTDDFPDTEPSSSHAEYVKQRKKELENETIIYRTPAGVKKYRKTDVDIFGRWKVRIDGKKRDGGTTDHFAEHLITDPGTDKRDPEKVVYDPGFDSWATGTPSDLPDREAPENNQLCITFRNKYISYEEILELLKGYITEYKGLEFNVLERRVLLDERHSFLRVFIEGMSKEQMHDYDIIDFAKAIKGTIEVKIGQINNKVDPASEWEESNIPDNEKYDNSFGLTETDEFSPDTERIQRLLDEKLDMKHGGPYGKEEKSPFWSGRFPNKYFPWNFDLSYIRTACNADTRYIEESPSQSTHYAFYGLLSAVLEVKWHKLPDARRPWAITACGKSNLCALLDDRAVLLNSAKYHNNWVTSMRWNHLGTRMVTASHDTRIMFYQQDGTPTALKHDSGEVNCAIFDRTSQYVFFGGTSRKLNIWDLKTGPHGETSSIDLNYDLNFLLTVKDNASLVITAGKFERHIDVWNIHTGEIVRQLSVESPLEDLRLSTHEDLIVATSGKFVYMWEYKSPSMGTSDYFEYDQGFQLHRKSWIGAKVAIAAVDEKLKRIAVVLKADKKVIRGYEYNGETTTYIRTFNGHKNRVSSIDLGPRGFLVSGSMDCTVRLWPWPTPNESIEVYRDFHKLLPLNSPKAKVPTDPMFPEIMDNKEISLLKGESWRRVVTAKDRPGLEKWKDMLHGLTDEGWPSEENTSEANKRKAESKENLNKDDYSNEFRYSQHSADIGSNSTDFIETMIKARIEFAEALEGQSPAAENIDYVKGYREAKSLVVGKSLVPVRTKQEYKDKMTRSFKESEFGREAELLTRQRYRETKRRAEKAEKFLRAKAEGVSPSDSDGASVYEEDEDGKLINVDKTALDSVEEEIRHPHPKEKRKETLAKQEREENRNPFMHVTSLAVTPDADGRHSIHGLEPPKKLVVKESYEELKALEAKMGGMEIGRKEEGELVNGGDSEVDRAEVFAQNQIELA